MFTMTDFLEQVDGLSPRGEQAAALWQAWACELAELDRREGLPSQTAEAFFEVICWKIRQTEAQYGPKAAQAALELSLCSRCIFPWDLPDAGDLLARGFKVDAVYRMAAAGQLAGERNWPA